MREGLERAQEKLPVGRWSLAALGTWTPQEGPVGRLEAAAHPWAATTGFAYGQLDRDGPSVGVGFRWEFD